MTPLEFEGGDTECGYCGSHVPDDFCRVFGDERDRAHRCPECDTHTRIAEGSAAGLAVPTPDPQTSLGRHGGEPADD